MVNDGELLWFSLLWLWRHESERVELGSPDEHRMAFDDEIDKELEEWHKILHPDRSQR